MDRRTSAKANRRARCIEALKNARETIGVIEPGMSLFAITRGQFSMIDVINTLLEQIDREGTETQISVWTWAIADYEVEVFSQLLERREIAGATLVIDYSAEGRNADLIQQWRDRFGHGNVKVCRNHAKIARVWNDDFRFLARGSMNLNYNPRFEQFDLTEGGEDFDMVERIERGLPVLKPFASRADADAATGVGGAWQQSELEFFDKVKTWPK